MRLPAEGAIYMTNAAQPSGYKRVQPGDSS